MGKTIKNYKYTLPNGYICWKIIDLGNYGNFAVIASRKTKVIIAIFDNISKHPISFNYYKIL